MTWTVFEHDMPRNLKVASLSHRAFRVWIEATCWSVGAGTNGLLPDSVPRAVWTTIRDPKPAIDELRKAGLFEFDPEGILVHDFAHYQEDPEKVAARREAARLRMRRNRNGNS